MSELNIPEHWVQDLLGKIITIRRGASPRPVGDPKYFGKGKVGWLRIADVTKQGKIILSTPETLTDEGVKKSVLVKPGELILSNSGTVGVPCFAGIDLCVHDGFLVFPNLPDQIDREYFYNFFLFFRSELQKRAKIGTQANLNIEIVSGINLPIPPMGEQKRIVQKIESCFQKIDETEKALNEVEVLLTKYRESLLAKAFRGELLPQDPKDEPASKFLEKIRSERARNSNGKKIQEFSPISDDEKPFDLPIGWEWVRLGDIIKVSSGKMLPANSQKGGDIPVYGGNGINGYHDEYNLEKPSIIIGRVGAKCGVVHIATQKSWVTDNALIVSFDENYIDLEWLSLILSDLNLNNLSNSSAQPVISGEKIYNVVLAIPVKEAQVKIRQKLSSQLDFLNNLLNSIIVKIRMARNLKDSILKNAFQGALVPRMHEEGTGHELLEKILNDQKEQPKQLKEKVLRKSIKNTTKKAKK